ncbi:unnamed protein product [Boreogadus saida]
MRVLAHAVRKYSLKVVSLGPGGVIPHITALHPQGSSLLPLQGGAQLSLGLGEFCGGTCACVEVSVEHLPVGQISHTQWDACVFGGVMPNAGMWILYRTPFGLCV